MRLNLPKFQKNVFNTFKQSEKVLFFKDLGNYYNLVIVFHKV